MFMHNIKEGFGANLRKIRKNKKLTVDTLAEISGISSRLISNIEAGDTFISAETLCKISVSLNVSLQTLFDFDWYDKLIYYDNGKYIKHHFKVNVSEKNQTAKIRSLPALSGYKINKIIPSSQFPSFLIEFVKSNDKTIYIDYFNEGKREHIFKVTPDGAFQYLVDLENMKKVNNILKENNYYVALEKIKELSVDKKKMEYIITAANALNDKKSREKLRLMLDAMDISK